MRARGASPSPALAASPPLTETLPWSFAATTVPSKTVSSDCSPVTRKTNSVPSMEPLRYGELIVSFLGLRLKE